MADPLPASYPVEALANAVLDQAERRGLEIGPMKLQKLMYLAHGYYTAITGRALVDEYFEAWQYGPVLPTIYQTFKKFGRGPIRGGFRARRLALDPARDRMELETPTIPDDDATLAEVMRFVFDTYGDKSAIYLSDLTHKLGSPWDQVRTGDPAMRNPQIPTPTIEAYFKKFI